jgi:hypothetical protein
MRREPLREALFHFHAGMIMHSLGDMTGAKEQLTLALKINPYFDVLDAQIAIKTLDQIA